MNAAMINNLEGAVNRQTIQHAQSQIAVAQVDPAAKRLA